MRDYGRVAPTFWTRGSGKRLRGNPHAQLVALYLFTCPASTMVGIYHMAIPTMAHEIGLPVEVATRALADVCSIGIAHYDTDAELIYLPGGARYQIGERLKPSDYRVKSIETALAQLNGHPFALDFARRYGAEFCLPPPEPKTQGGSMPLAAQATCALEAKQSKDQAKQEKPRVGFETTPPSGAGLFSPVEVMVENTPSDGPALDHDLFDPSKTDPTPIAPTTDAATEPAQEAPPVPVDLSVPATVNEPAQTALWPDLALQPAAPAPVAADKAPMPAAAAPAQPTSEEAEKPKKHDPVAAIFAEYIAGWKRTVGGRRPPTLDEKRRTKTLTRLKEFDEEDLKSAARGIFASPWNVENKQVAFDLVIRDAAHVERFMAFDDGTRPPPPAGAVVPEWLTDAARPSARVRDALRKSPPPADDGAAFDLDAIIADANSVQDVL